MDPGLVTSLSGALAQAKRVEVLSNNIANADTVAFKGDDLVFEEALQAAHQPETRNDVPEKPFSESELLSRSGDEQRTVLYGSEYTNLRMGAFKPTGNPMDVAIEGNGFLEVLTPDGVRLTRAGNLTLDAGGRLVTHDGFLVLGQGTQEPALRALTVGAGRFSIDMEGNIMGGQAQGAANLGRLSILQVNNPKALRKDGRNLFLAPPDAGVRPYGGTAAAARQPAQQAAVAGANPQQPEKANPLGSTLRPPRILQGMLESSNVNPVQEMTKLIEAHRLFDQNTRMMQTIGDAAGRVSEVGKF